MKYEKACRCAEHSKQMVFTGRGAFYISNRGGYDGICDGFSLFKPRA